MQRVLVFIVDEARIFPVSVFMFWRIEGCLVPAVNRKILLCRPARSLFTKPAYDVPIPVKYIYTKTTKFTSARKQENLSTVLVTSKCWFQNVLEVIISSF
jgi:hypothetical protein